MTDIRPADPPADYARVAELLNSVQHEPTTAAILLEQSRHRPTVELHRWTVAEAGGRVVGCGLVARRGWGPTPDAFWTWVVVEPAARGRGVGAALAESVLAFARAQGAERVTGQVRDDDPASLAFAARRGFAAGRHWLESVLDLRAFDAAPFRGAVAGLEAAGVRFSTLAREGDTPEVRRGMDALGAEVFPDIPGDGGPVDPFEYWGRPGWTEPEDQIVALHGGRPVGTTWLGRFSPTGAMYNDLTGVARDWRGRGLALGLKVVAIWHALELNAPYLRTNNDARNGPMLAVNRKLGYAPVPGWRQVVRNS